MNVKSPANEYSKVNKYKSHENVRRERLKMINKNRYLKKNH
jgi:hypothetical protein